MLLPEFVGSSQPSSWLSCSGVLLVELGGVTSDVSGTDPDSAEGLVRFCAP